MTAPRTWDVTLRFVVLAPADDSLPENWSWRACLDDVWGNVEATFLSATEVKAWRFGDIITEDNKPDRDFRVADKDGDATDYLPKRDDGPYRLIWLDGQELVCAATC